MNEIEFFKDKAIYVGDTESCLKAVRLINNDLIFPTTLQRLKQGDTEYKYLIFDNDQFVGYNDLEIWDTNSIGRWFEKELQYFEL